MAVPKPVRKAVLPVAGIGTRFLPATKVVPKEMLPVVDKPVIQYAVEEAKEAGIEQFIFVTGRGKHVIADHFDHAYELESLLSAREKTAELDSLLEGLPITGLGRASRASRSRSASAMRCGARAISSATSLSRCCCRTICMVGKPSGLAQMMRGLSPRRRRLHRGGRGKARAKRPSATVSSPPARTSGNATEVKALVEKPDPAKAPSTLCIIGRYILQPEIFAELDKQEKGAGGEIQLTDSMARLIGRMPFHAVRDDLRAL